MGKSKDTNLTSLEGWHLKNDVRYVTANAIMLTLAPIILAITTIVLMQDPSYWPIVYVTTSVMLIPLPFAALVWWYRYNYRGHDVDAGYECNFFVKDAQTVLEEIVGRLPQTVRTWKIVSSQDDDDNAFGMSSRNLTLAEEDGVILSIILNRQLNKGFLAIEVTTSDRTSPVTRDLLRSINDIMEDLVKPWPAADLKAEKLMSNEGIVKGWTNMDWSIARIRWNSWLALVIIVELVLILAVIIVEPNEHEPEYYVLMIFTILAIQCLLPLTSVFFERYWEQYREDVLITYKNIYPHTPTYVTEVIEEALVEKGWRFGRSRRTDPENRLPCERFDLLDMKGAKVFIYVSREGFDQDCERTVVYIRTSRLVGDIGWTQLLVHTAV